MYIDALHLQTGDQDEQRLASRTGFTDAFTRSLAILKMTLPGPPLIYYGEELNMVDGTLAVFQTSDPTVSIWFINIH